jgi:RNA polymerase-interacting CarD/CdnL/TRCF family regulator
MSSALKSRTKPSFNVGDAVVHPRHGAGRIVSQRRRRLLGTTRDYLEIDLPHASLERSMSASIW